MFYLFFMSCKLIKQQVSKIILSIIINFIAARSYNFTSSVWKKVNDVTSTLFTLIYFMCFLTVFIYMQLKNLFLIHFFFAWLNSVKSDIILNLANFNNILSQLNHHLIFFWNVAQKYLFNKQFMSFTELFFFCSYSKKVFYNYYDKLVIHWISNKQFNFCDDIIFI